MKISHVTDQTDMLTTPFYERVSDIVGRIDFHHDSQFGVDVGAAQGRVYIQVTCLRPDTYTGEFGTGFGGKRFLNSNQTDGEIVRTVFGAFLAYQEHEVREAFTYRGKRIYGPHIDPEALLEAADHIEQRDT